MISLRSVGFMGWAIMGWTIVALAVPVEPAGAQSNADFFRGKSINLTIPSDAGGGYDTYVRLLARHYQKHIPGSPNMVPQNVPGGCGLIQANRLFNTEPKDGTAIGLVRASVLYEGVFGNPQAKFDGRKFAWIGNLNADRDTCVFWHTTGINSPKDFYGKDVLVGATGIGAMSFSFPSVYNAVLGTKLKIIMGYKGTPDRILAMERGEIQGACGLTTGTFRATLEKPYKESKLKLVAIAGLSEEPNFPDVPNMINEAKTPEQRQALEFLFAQMEIGRAVPAPPGTPEGRVAILRRGFDATMKDKGFLAEATKLKLDISPIDRTAMPRWSRNSMPRRWQWCSGCAEPCRRPADNSCRAPSQKGRPFGRPFLVLDWFYDTTAIPLLGGAHLARFPGTRPRPNRRRPAGIGHRTAWPAFAALRGCHDQPGHDQPHDRAPAARFAGPGAASRPLWIQRGAQRLPRDPVGERANSAAALDRDRTVGASRRPAQACHLQQPRRPASGGTDRGPQPAQHARHDGGGGQQL